jgi:hypothetical protein
MTKNMGLKSLHKFHALFNIATPAVKEEGYIVLIS